MKKRTRHWMLACLLFNLGILAVIKYTDFMISNINSIFHTGFTFMNFALPMGISFYTFQSMGYLIDVYRQNIPVRTACRSSRSSCRSFRAGAGPDQPLRCTVATAI